MKYYIDYKRGRRTERFVTDNKTLYYEEYNWLKNDPSVEITDASDDGEYDYIEASYELRHFV